MHFINYSIRPDQTVRRFGLWPFYSGIILLIICQMIYTGAFEDVKRPTFEIFWYSHHLFIFYFVITLLHGEGGFNPAYWKFFIVPGVLYILERILRFIRGRRHVVVLSAFTAEPNLLSIELDKQTAFGADGFREGQYVFVNCPSVKPYEWHPFTISSPPQKTSFTLHIQIQGAGSWTRGVKNFLMSMAPKDAQIVDFTRRNNQGQVVKGKTHGPNGLQILMIDGPHSAPTQHMTEYEVAMIAGAGIGLTPVIACAESIVYHRWKFSSGKVFPAHAHFFWVVSYRDIEAYRWFASKVIDCQIAVNNLRSKGGHMQGKTFKFNIYITSVPKAINMTDVKLALEDEGKLGYWGRASALDEKTIVQDLTSFSKRDLFAYMLNPTEKERKFDDITIITGRPKWEGQFREISNKYPSKDVGVMFCGNRFIGKDLKKMCSQFSSVERKQFFRLHKENF